MGRPVFRGLWPGRPPAIPGGRGAAAALYLRPRTPIKVSTGAKCGLCGARECMHACHVSAERRACDPNACGIYLSCEVGLGGRRLVGVEVGAKTHTEPNPMKDKRRGVACV